MANFYISFVLIAALITFSDFSLRISFKLKCTLLWLHFGWSIEIILKNLDPKRKILEATRTFRSYKMHCFKSVSSTERYYVIVWGKPALPIKIETKRQFSIFLLLFCFFFKWFWSCFILQATPHLPYEFTVLGMLERLNAYVEYQVCDLFLRSLSLAQYFSSLIIRNNKTHPILPALMKRNSDFYAMSSAL